MRNRPLLPAIHQVGSLRAATTALALAVGGTGCARTNVSEGADGGVDARLTIARDAVVAGDSPTTDVSLAARPDSAPHPDVAVDAHMMDAWAAEACDGMDDDGDREVDESPTDCREAPFASASVCVDGNCVCRASGVVPRPGDHEDCNGDFSDGCETPVDTETNCGGCGVHCDIVSRCTDGEAGWRAGPWGSST